MNNIRPVLFSVLLALALFACAKEGQIRKQFDASVEEYNSLLSAQRFDDASLFAADAFVGEFKARAEAAKNIKVVDYSVIRTNYNEQMKSAEVEVEIDYYSLSSYTAKSLKYKQKWAYVTENNVAQWKLISGIPEFP